MTLKGIMIAAPQSGAGKTSVVMGILAALYAQGIKVRAAKAGPDYIDPSFHSLACHTPSVNLDSWAMSPDMIRSLAHAQDGEILIVEAAMGVLDSAADGRGAASDLAHILNLPVIMVLDCTGQAQSAVLACLGFQSACPDLTLSGVILNNIGSQRHGAMIKAALGKASIPVIGQIMRRKALSLENRHLGLVPANEISRQKLPLDQWKTIAEEELDLKMLIKAARSIPKAKSLTDSILPPLGQNIAIARDDAFVFTYPHILNDWRNAGAEVQFFSPLANETPSENATAVFLPGGYPELHAGKLAAAHRFRNAMQKAAANKKTIYGECGGFMTLGKGLVDKNGAYHKMLGLLPIETSFEKRQLTLGYRILHPSSNAPFSRTLMGHEFHYSTIISHKEGNPLFEADFSDEIKKMPMGFCHKSVSGSFAHIIAEKSI